mgnify:CR=1 FL=1
MPTRSRKGKNNGDTQLDESGVSGGFKPVAVERGKKFAVYDKNGKLIILGYNRRIVQEYADAQSKIRFERQRKD